MVISLAAGSSHLDILPPVFLLKYFVTVGQVFYRPYLLLVTPKKQCQSGEGLRAASEDHALASYFFDL